MTNMHVVAISVFIAQSYGSRAAVIGFCEVCSLVSSVEYCILNLTPTDRSGRNIRHGSHNFQLTFFVVNRQRVSWRTYGLLCLCRDCGNGVVCVGVVAGCNTKPGGNRSVELQHGFQLVGIEYRERACRV
jgi:hypothetical protein